MVSDKLKIRAEVKKRKPTYKRVQSHQFAKLSEVKWRKPKGMGNKVRGQRRGKPSMPQVGFGSPKEVRGFNKAGFKEVVVNNVADLSKVDTKIEIAVISSTVGVKKRLEILTQAKAKKISLANIKDIDIAIKANTKVKKENKKATISKSDSKSKKTDSNQKSKPESESKKVGGKKE